MPCLFPLCKFHPQSNGYCIHHGKNHSNTVAVKPPKEINKEGAKQKNVKKELKKLYPMFLKKHPKCEVKLSPDCTKVAVCIHHTKGRGVTEVLDQKTWVASCVACNDWVEANHTEAAAAGMKKSRHKIETS